MIRRYGTCAILAWEKEKVVGFLRFYPLNIVRLVAESGGEQRHPIAVTSMRFERDPTALWVQCVMTSGPYENSDQAKKVGARKGIGLKIVKGLVSWAKEHGWKRIVKQAHSDLDCFYGICGGGGRAFWEKAGFKVMETFREKNDFWGDYWTDTIERQRNEKGMTTQEVWTYYQMNYDL